MPFISRIRGLFKQVRTLPKAFAQAKKGTIKRKLVTPFRQNVRKARIKAFRLWLNISDRAIGPEASNATFWRVRDTHEWPSVETRLLQLAEQHPDALAHFVEQSYQATRNPHVIINLARSELSRDTLRTCLMNETFEADSTARQRIQRSQLLLGAFVATATLLLPEEKAAAFAAQATEINPQKTKVTRSFIDCCGKSITATPHTDARRYLPASGFRSPKSHRLIIAASNRHVPTLPLLFQGAEKVTVFILDDLYGRVSFEDRMQHCSDCQVDVEHLRSRITRFSADYHRVHEDTRAAAESIVHALDETTPDAFPMTDIAGTEIALADTLFFPCLQFVALEKLVASSEFDHIVVAMGGSNTATPKANSDFVRLLSGIEELRSDNRVEAVCLSPNTAGLNAFSDLVKVLSTKPDLSVEAEPDKQPLLPAIEAMQNRIKAVLPTFPEWSETDKPRVLLATSQVAAYNRSSAAYSETLADIGNLQIAFLGGNLMAFSQLTDERISPDTIVPMPQSAHKSDRLLHAWLTEFLEEYVHHAGPSYVAHVILNRLPSVARDGILAYLTHATLCDAWFTRLKANDQLPKVAVLTPFRSVRVTALSEAARRHNVPTIAVEPHGLNASYCRYSKVTADFYGVISQFFAQAAVDGFGMSLDRAPVVGSPRLEAPVDYDLAERTATVRAELSEANEIAFPQGKPVFSFFSQPSDWSQISEVWRIILEATDNIDCTLVLKTHPEETASRVAAYHAIVQELNATARVVVLEADAIAVIEASDLVMSGYSATVLEAALYRRPVFCVTNGDTQYPLNQHDIIGGPLFSDASSLRREINALIENPQPYHDLCAAFLQREPQLLEGFEGPFKKLVSDVIALPPERALRSGEARPKSLFIDGPHQVFKI
ncbi:hypothetical protein [Thalassobius sp. I31.1]|uniref:hypothetical protein n=1 Tax=Thalassobius sp. I31.1 TaxID=2109912 RepID=UPI000D1BC9FC|nr:hypothetical protein [Thalassobius sp. I31.1]